MSNPKRKLKDPYKDLIPFYSDGSVPWKRPKEGTTHYRRSFDYTTGTYLEGGQIEWKENKPFKAALKFKRVINKRSAVQFIMENTETGATYYVSEANFNEMMEKTTWILGVCLGEWLFHSYRGYLSIVPSDKVGEVK